jgi:hypothetical protein
LEAIPTLKFVYVAHNKIIGSAQITWPVNLSELSIANNQLSGSFIARNSQLGLIDISGNTFNNLIIENNTVLTSLLANNNLIHDPIIEGSPSLYRLDLSYNNLTELPSFLNFGSSLSQLNIVLLKGNQISGTIPLQQIYSTSVMTLDLSYNYLLSDLYPTFHYYSPYITTDLVGGNYVSCYCFPDAKKRSINIIANRLTAATLTIKELTLSSIGIAIPQVLNVSIPLCDSCATSLSQV